MLARRQFLGWLMATMGVPLVSWPDRFALATRRKEREPMPAPHRSNPRYLARGPHGIWGISMSPDASTVGAAEGRLGSEQAVLGIMVGETSGRVALVDAGGIIAVQRLE